MIEVVNKIIPFKGYAAMAVWPFVFVRKEYHDRLKSYQELYDKMRRHESIHGEQQKEILAAAIVITALLVLIGCGWWSLLALPLFLWWYLAEWLVRSIQYESFNVGYKNISFEREAYFFQDDVGYLERRKPWSWVRWLKTVK